MASILYNFGNTEGFDFENEGVYVSGGLMGLRPIGDSGDADFITGTLKRSYVDLPTWCPFESIFEKFCGISAQCSLNGGGIFFQLSPDAGDSFRWYDGVEWTDVINEDDYNTLPEVEEFIEEFKEWHTLRIRIILIPSDDEKSPILGQLSLFVEYRPHEMLEDVFRSLHRFIKESSNFVMPYITSVEDPTDTIKLTFEDIGVEGDIEKVIGVKEPIWVFEISSDPKMRNNLFESFDGTDIIKLTKEVSGTIKVLFTAIPDIHIQTDFDLVPISNHPSIVIQILSVARNEWDGPGNYPCYEINFSKKIAKASEGLRKYEIRVKIKSYAAKTTDSLIYTGGVRRLIEQKDRIKSVFYDTYMEALWGNQSTDDWSTQNWFSQAYTPTLVWEDWAAKDTPKEVPLVEELRDLSFRLLSEC